jgi:hypothetical protein
MSAWGEMSSGLQITSLKSKKKIFYQFRLPNKHFAPLNLRSSPHQIKWSLPKIKRMKACVRTKEGQQKAITLQTCTCLWDDHLIKDGYVLYLATGPPRPVHKRDPYLPLLLQQPQGVYITFLIKVPMKMTVVLSEKTCTEMTRSMN